MRIDQDKIPVSRAVVVEGDDAIDADRTLRQSLYRFGARELDEQIGGARRCDPSPTAQGPPSVRAHYPPPTEPIFQDRIRQCAVGLDDVAYNLCRGAQTDEVGD